MARSERQAKIDSVIRFATSMSRLYAEKYGHRLVRTFLDWVDSDIAMEVWHEGEDLELPTSDRLVRRNLYEETGLGGFLDAAVARGAKPPPTDPDLRVPPRYDYRHDAFTFAKKAYAFVGAAGGLEGGTLFWVDADVVFLKSVTGDWLRGLIVGYDLSCFRRVGPHTETGFYGIDLSTAPARAFVRRYADLWDGGGIFYLPGWTDSDTFDAALGEVPGLRVRNLSTRTEGHVMAASPLAAYMDHLKGPRKKAGRSWELDR